MMGLVNMKRRRRMKRILIFLLTGAFISAGLAGCAGGAGGKEIFEPWSEINVVSREDGSGTRGAFTELLGLEKKGENGSKTDLTTDEAIITNKTGVMLMDIAGDKYGIGYISLGSLNESVKPVNIDGVQPTAENIKNGSYTVARPFNIATKGEKTGVAADFMCFILSAEGQKIVSEGYISINDSAEPFKSDMSSGKIVVAGSSSVTPVMEKLTEAYLLLNTNADIEVQMSDSTSGMTGAIEGTCDIGMASRPLKESELQVLTPTAIALDGIVIIVNNMNPVSNLSRELVAKIYAGDLTAWDEVIQLQNSKDKERD
jgi:phosphate transport system substrate-binding protein